MLKSEIEETIKYQDNLIRHQNNLLDKYVLANSNIRQLVREHATGKISSDLLVNYLKLYVDWRD